MNIDGILKDDLTQKLIREFGIEGESAETKASLLAQLGENISGRVLLEATKKVPEDQREAFFATIETSDLNSVKQFLQLYVSDFEQFVREEAQKEIERTKTYMHEEMETATTGGGE
jgi:hypothetical protein